MDLAQGYNTATRVRIKPPTSPSGVGRSTTRPPRLPRIQVSQVKEIKELSTQIKNPELSGAQENYFIFHTYIQTSFVNNCLQIKLHTNQL